MKEYKKIIEAALGFSVPKGYLCHHIDFNHENNNLDNFLIIPKALHIWIHRCKGTQDLFVSNVDKFRGQNNEESNSAGGRPSRPHKKKSPQLQSDETIRKI